MSRGFTRDANPPSSKATSSRRWLVFGGAAVGVLGVLGALTLSSKLGNSAALADTSNSVRAELNPKTLADYVFTTADEVQYFWGQDFERRGSKFTAADVLVHLTDEAATCGSDRRAAGSFYCSPGRAAHFDLEFYRALHTRCPSEANAAEAYVVAHTLAHHVQTTLGLDALVDELAEKRKGTRHAMGVRMDLQADCFAGVWARKSSLAEPLKPENFEVAQRCASEVATQDTPKEPARSESFTHGSIKQRAYWFNQGYRGGRIQDCDTFAPAQP